MKVLFWSQDLQDLVLKFKGEVTDDVTYNALSAEEKKVLIKNYQRCNTNKDVSDLSEKKL